MMENKMNFETGKMYTHNEADGNVFFIIGKTRQGEPYAEIVKGPSKGEFTTLGYKTDWVEYKEPVVHKRTLIWYKPKGLVRAVLSTVITPEPWNDDLYYTYNNLGYEILHHEEVTYTEK